MSCIETQERGRQIVESTVRAATEIAEALQVPSGAEVWKAGGDAGRDGYVALQSLFHLLFLVLRPVALGLGWFSVVAGRFIWKHVVVGMIYNHGLSQTKESIVKFWRFQKSLTRQQLMIEAVIVVLLIALYLLRRWLRRNRYIERARDAFTAQTEKVAQVCLIDSFLFMYVVEDCYY